jgi:hypothetical protein
LIDSAVLFIADSTVYIAKNLPLRKLVIVTVRHMYAATAAAAPDHEGSTSATSKGNTRGEQAMYIERTTTLPKALFFSP